MAVGLRAWFVEELSNDLGGFVPPFSFSNECRLRNERTERQPAERYNARCARVGALHIHINQVSAIRQNAVRFGSEKYPVFFTLKHRRGYLRAKNRPIVFGCECHRVRWLLAQFPE